MNQIGGAAQPGVRRAPDIVVPTPTSADRRGTRPVRAVSAPDQRICVRPSCAAPARATLVFAYDDRIAMLASLASEYVPQAYDLCAVHASRTRAPRGWTLEDRRSPDEQGIDGPSPMSTDLGGDRTVAVLAAALRAGPDPVFPEADAARS